MKWSHIENVFLVGAVSEVMFKDGLFSEKANRYSSLWQQIFEVYERNWKNYREKTRVKRQPFRTPKDIFKHFEKMKISCYHEKDLRELYLEWELRFASKKFNDFLKKMMSETDVLKQDGSDEKDEIYQFFKKKRFSQYYYNTVQGYDAKTMAKQLKNEQILFHRLYQKKESEDKEILQGYETDDDSTPKTLPILKSQKGSIFELFGLKK